MTIPKFKHQGLPTMHKTIYAATITILLALCIVVASGQAPAQPPGVLSVLHVDQQVNLNATSGGYEIGLFENGPDQLGHKVVEIGADYVVVKDIANVTTTRIPIYSVKAVTIMTIPKRAK